MYCYKCGRIIEDNEKKCPFCGADIQRPIDDKEVIIEEIRSKTAIELQESRNDLELEKLYYDEGKAIRKEKRNWKSLGKFYLVFGILLAILFTWITIDDNLSERRGEITPGIDNEECVGERYTTVIMQLEDSGFTNITPRPLNDLDDSTDINKVYKVMIDGRTSFSSTSYFPPDTEIIVYYHSMSSE